MSRLRRSTARRRAYVDAKRLTRRPATARSAMPSNIYVTSSGPQVGLALGRKTWLPARVTGVTPTPPKALPVAWRIWPLTALARSRHQPHAEDVPTTASPVQAMACRPMQALPPCACSAHTEGTFLDPAHWPGDTGLSPTSAAALARRRLLSFVHTGGLPAIFAYADSFPPVANDK